MKALNSKQQKELGFLPFRNSNFEFVHWSEEIMLSTKENLIYEFCEVKGVGAPITRVNNYQELKMIIKDVLLY